MWALIDKNNIVIDYIVEKTFNEATIIAEKNNAKLIQMTIENSPAYISGFWDGKKFHESGRI